MDDALRVDATERERRRKELSALADQVVTVVTRVDQPLPALRRAR